MRDKPLEAKIENGLLTISIGIETLCGAVNVGPMFDQAEVTDIDLFSADLLTELMSEAEDGSTPIHRMLDEAAEAALEAGSEGIKLLEDEEA